MSQESTPLDRALTERQELQDKLVALYAFTLTDKFKSLSEVAQGRLKGQAHFMEKYHEILTNRIKHDLTDQQENLPGF